MTEEEALNHLGNVPRETMAALETYIAALVSENAQQNLVAASTLPHIWARHVVDSAQLLDHAAPGDWLDLGSGAGFPGLVIAAIGSRRATLVENRTRRAAFLRSAANLLGVADRVEIVDRRLEMLPPTPFAVISARAFAPLERLFNIAHPFATPATQWLLPKGRSAAQELAAAQRSWQGNFRIVPSITDPESAIIVATDVRRRGGR